MAEDYTQEVLVTFFTCVQAYLGSHIGSHCLKTTWLEEKVTTWTVAIETLTAVAKHYPQLVQATVTLSLQGEG